MKFSDYAKQNEKTTENSKEEKNESIENIYDKYKNMSQADLLASLADNVKKQKENGSFDFDAIQASIDKILPYLSEEQKQTMLSLLSGLK